MDRREFIARLTEARDTGGEQWLGRRGVMATPSPEGLRHWTDSWTHKGFGPVVSGRRSSSVGRAATLATAAARDEMAVCTCGGRNGGYSPAHDTKLQDRETQRFFEGQRVAVFQGFANQAVRRLTLLDSAETLGDLAALPSNRLEALRGDRAGQHSIRINMQWRICFRWTDDGPYDVEIADYH